MRRSIYLHHREVKIKTLGPGSRYVLWVQGCTHNCPNCIAPETHSLKEGGYDMSIEDILIEIKKNKKELAGVTISGGEPFLQAEVLAYFLKEVKKIGLNIICYTGFLYEELKKGNIPYSKELLKYIDLLIDGKYVENLNRDNYLRGSENQRMIFLTGVLKKYEFQMKNLKNRNIEIRVVDNKTLFVAGIPPKNLNDNWKNIREKLYKK